MMKVRKERLLPMPISSSRLEVADPEREGQLDRTTIRPWLDFIK
jgi:hypothetical protein